MGICHLKNVEIQIATRILSLFRNIKDANYCQRTQHSIELNVSHSRICKEIFSPLDDKYFFDTSIDKNLSDKSRYNKNEEDLFLLENGEKKVHKDLYLILDNINQGELRLEKTLVETNFLNKIIKDCKKSIKNTLIDVKKRIENIKNCIHQNQKIKQDKKFT